jgi:hypothetical protein
MPTAHEHFSNEFHAWEVRGRGWKVFDVPVYPEPPFVPSVRRMMTETPAVDDGRRPTFLSSLAKRLTQKPKPIEPVEEAEEPEPVPLIRDSQVEFQAMLPDDADLSPEAFERVLLNLSLCREPLSFEFVGCHGRVVVQFAACEDDFPLVRGQMEAHFPEIQFRQKGSVLENAWQTSSGDRVGTVEFALKREFMYPLACGRQDLFVGLVGALGRLQPGELGVFQVLFQAAHEEWAENIIHSVTDNEGKPLFVNEPGLTVAAEKKVARPLFAAVVRILARAETTSRLHEIVCGMASPLRGFGDPSGNSLIPLATEEYPLAEHVADIMFRQSRRSGMILNSEELTGFVHLPGSAVRSPALQRDTGRTKAAPAIVRKPPGIVIGDNEHADETVSVFLTPDQRVRHTHIIGQNGTGKSSLLLNLIRQDIENGDGIAVLDPHGDLIDQILEIIPDERIDDVVLVDPADTEFPIGFNILQAHSEEEKTILASDLVSVFRRLSTSWGDQMDTVLKAGILAILESSRGGTLMDLRRFLRDAPFRREFLRTVRDPELIEFWEQEFSQLGGGKSVGSILTRLQDFFSQKSIRNMVSQRENRLDFADIMDSGKIFLAKLSEGLGGEENSYLLGTLLVSKFQQLAMARQKQAVGIRRDFWLYIDEFQHFISPSMAKILTGLRKYRIGFTLSHQHLHQLQSDPKVASAVMTEPCTRIVLRVGDDDAKRLGECFTSFDAKSLTRLEQFHAIVRVERNDFDFNLALRKPELVEGGTSRKTEIIAASRAKYATPRQEVEEALLAAVRHKGDDSEAKAEPEVQPVKPHKPAAPEPETPVAPSPPKPADVSPPIPEPMPPPLEGIPVTVSGKESAKPADMQTTAKPKELGRGLALHKSIQKRIRDGAREYGFLSDVEKQLAKGSNKAADLVLQQGDVVYAVEIAVSPSISHEFENVQKCLAAGFVRVAVIATGRKRLDDMAAAVQSGLGPTESAKVGYYTPDEFLDELQRLAKTIVSTAETLKKGKVLGFEVERDFPQQSAEEQRWSQNALNEIARSVLEK